MKDNFEIFNDAETLCLRNKETGDIIGKHKLFGKKIAEYKRIGQNCNVIREDEKTFPKDQKGSKPNIYCLDDKFKIKWKVKMPMDDDCFPNPITWNKKAIELKRQDGSFTLKVNDSPNTFICKSLRGFTVTVDYLTGQTIDIEFAKQNTLDRSNH